MSIVPVIWDETVFIDGYPGKYVVLARKNGDKWYVAAINAEKEVNKNLTVKLPMLANNTVMLYSDKNDRSPQLEKVNINDSGEITLIIQPEGGVIVKN